MALDVLDLGFQISESNVAARYSADTLARAPSDYLVVALDTSTVREAEILYEKLKDQVEILKIGLELVMSEGGLTFARNLCKQGRRIFLDMKLLDIGNTVEHAVTNVARNGFHFLTVHGKNRKVLDAAVAGRRRVQSDNSPDRLRLLAVTVLTDQITEDLREEGITEETALDLAARRAQMAEAAGFDGVIASGREAKKIRQMTSDKFIVKVPGIRPAGASIGDQKRTMTPTEAIAAGATYIVVGRPIYQAPDPILATERILDEISRAIMHNDRQI
jgi:orotidine-5'-phosphate decarboxylase